MGAHRRSKGGAKGDDAGKKTAGRTRHILTDTDGRLLCVRVQGADIQDRDGGKPPLKASRRRCPFIAHWTVRATAKAAGLAAGQAFGRSGLRREAP
ncbi:transposase [Xanthobacter cornucopiae]|uniref:transposase n=1 Tax=Xanthobacter cornucopiae TaxID=3119924 RepID=UPI00372D65C9